MEERGRRDVVGPSFLLNKAMMGDRLGTTSQAETGPASLCSWRIPQEGGEGGRDGAATIRLLRAKSMPERENVFVRCKMCRYVCLHGAGET